MSAWFTYICAIILWMFAILGGFTVATGVYTAIRQITEVLG